MNRYKTYAIVLTLIILLSGCGGGGSGGGGSGGGNSFLVWDKGSWDKHKWQ